mgnify:CR=1 FL=1
MLLLLVIHHGMRKVNKKFFCFNNSKNQSLIFDFMFSAAVAAKTPIVGVLCGGFEEKLLRESGCQWIYRDILDLTKNYDQVTKDILKKLN